MDNIDCIHSKLRSYKGDCKVTHREELTTGLCYDCEAGRQVEKELEAAARADQRHFLATFPPGPQGSATTTRPPPDGQEAPQRAFPDKGQLRLLQPQKGKKKRRRKS